MGSGGGASFSNGDHSEQRFRVEGMDPASASIDPSVGTDECARSSNQTTASPEGRPASEGRPSSEYERAQKSATELQSSAPSSASDSPSARNRRRRRKRPSQVPEAASPSGNSGPETVGTSNDETGRATEAASERDADNRIARRKGERERMKKLEKPPAQSLPSTSSSKRVSSRSNSMPVVAGRSPPPKEYNRSASARAPILQSPLSPRKQHCVPREGLRNMSHHPPPPPPPPPSNSRLPFPPIPVSGALLSPSSREGSPAASMVRFGHAALRGSNIRGEKEGEKNSHDQLTRTSTESLASYVAEKREPDDKRVGIVARNSTAERGAHLLLSLEGTSEESAIASPGLGSIGGDFQLLSPPPQFRRSMDAGAGRRKSHERQSGQLKVQAHPEEPQRVPRPSGDSCQSDSRNITNPASDSKQQSTASSSSKLKQNTPSFLRKSSQLRWPAGVSPSILYVREPERGSGENRDLVTQTQLAKISLEEDQRDLVFGDSSFQIHVVGLHIGDDEETAASGLVKLGLTSPSPSSQKHRVLYSTRKDPSNGVSTTIPAVHYDSIRRESRNRMNREYVHVSRDKGSVTRGRGGSREVLSLAMQFVMFQIQGSELGRNAVRATLENVDALNQTLDSLSSTNAPFYALLAPFIRISGGLGTAALEQAGCKSRLLDADISFRLVSRDPTLNPVGEAFLRFGYYFILSQPCQDKLFTQVAASENIRLFTRREKDGSLHPTKHLTYVVVQVSEQVRLSSQQQLPPILPAQSNAQADDAVSTAFAREHSRSAYCKGVFPPLQDTVGDMEILRKALHDVREAPAEDFRDRILALMDDMKSTR